jgi:septal ring factor EnvC (AmiA/AmiB activator)
MIPVDHHDLDSVEEARKDIVAQIRSIEQKKPEQIETPISVALNLQQLRQSENAEQRTLADLMSAISKISKDLSELKQAVYRRSRNIPVTWLLYNPA